MNGRQAFLGRRYCKVSFTAKSFVVGVRVPLRYEGVSRGVSAKRGAALSAYPSPMLARGGVLDGRKAQAGGRSIRVSNANVQRTAAALDGCDGKVHVRRHRLLAS